MYNTSEIETKWRKIWEKSEIYKVKDNVSGKNNFYHLIMFPYPSGDLHIGHWYNYAPADVFARFKRMKGYNILSPIGFDAFGLPAENAAITRKIHPKVWTYRNIAKMRRQLKSMGNIYDFSREVVTADPEYYKWTQWIFLQMYKNGLAYKKKALANWCPKDQAVLANEQVVDGRCWRHPETLVIQKEIEQWMLKITDYAEELLNGLNKLDWPERTKLMQKNWIGKSEGVIVKFQISNQKSEKKWIDVYTTRPDTLFGATYIVISPEHSLLELVTTRENKEDIRHYVANSHLKTELERTSLEKEKTGVFTGSFALNPANNEKIPIWVSNYVLMNYGTGAIMAVPAHDERDFEFAKKFNLQIRNVIEPLYFQTTEPGKIKDGIPFDERNAIIAIVKHWKEEKYMALKWKKVAWGTFITGGIEVGQTAEEAAKMEIREETGFLHPKLIADFGIVHGKFYHVPKKINRFAHSNVLLFHLQDGSHEVISDAEREKHEVLWLTKDELKRFLTPDTHKRVLEILEGRKVFTGTGILTNSGKFSGVESELAKNKITEFVNGKMKTQYRLRDWIISRQRYWGTPIPIIYCSKCGTVPVSEKSLPVKLPPLKNFKPVTGGKSPLARVKSFINTKCPKCRGKAERETDTMDTFVDSSWYFLRYVDSKNKKIFSSKNKLRTWLPVNMYIGGAEHAVLHLLYSRFFIKALKDMGYLDFDEPFMALCHQGIILGGDGQKMSKSRGNIVDPDSLVRKFGADAVKMYLCFMGEYSKGGPWNPTGILGIKRFLDRIYAKFSIFNFQFSINEDSELQKLLHQTIKKVGDDINNFRFNTAISSLMILFNYIEKTTISKNTYEIVLKILAPFAPHFAEELWHLLGNKKLIYLESWPKYDIKFLEIDKYDLIIQINGKMRDKIRISKKIEKLEVEKLVLAREIIKKYLGGKLPIKIIFVPDRLINIVI